MRRMLLGLLCLGAALAPAAWTSPPIYSQAGCAAPSGELTPAPVQLPAPSGELALAFVGSYGGSIGAVAANATAVYRAEGAALATDTAQNGRSARTPLPDLVRDLAIDATTVYVAAGAGGLQTLSQAGARLGELRGPGLAAGVRVVDGRAYLAAAGPGGGLQIVDVTSPARPRLLGAAPTYGSATALEVVGGLAYVAGGYGGGLQIFDVTNPLSPTLRGGLITPGSAQGVALRGDRAYLAAGVCGLQVIDVADPARPRLLGAIATGGEALAVAVAGARAVVAAGAGGFAAFELGADLPRRSAAPALPAGATTSDVFIAGPLVYLVGRDSLFRATLAQLDFGSRVGSSFTEMRSIEVRGADVRLGLGDGSLLSLDISQPAAPRLNNQRRLRGQVIGLGVAGAALYAASGDEYISSVDLATAAAPRPLRVGGSTQTVVADPPRARAYVAAGSAGVHLLATSSPLSPTLVATIDTPGAALGLDLAPNGLLYVADRSGLQIVDPAGRRILGAYTATPGGFVQGVAVAGGRAYLADRSGLLVVDVRDPARPRLRGAAGGFSGYAVRVEGAWAYVAAGPVGLLAFSLADPDRPRLAASYDTPGSARSLALSGGLISIADNEGGLIILRPIALPNRIALPLIGR